MPRFAHSNLVLALPVLVLSALPFAALAQSPDVDDAKTATLQPIAPETAPTSAALASASNTVLTPLPEPPCLQITDDLTRLACFDRAALTPEDPGQGAWILRSDPPGVDGKSVVHLALLSTQNVPSPFEQFQNNAHAVLALRCMEGQTSFYVSFAENLMSDQQDFGSITYRIDNAVPGSHQMQVSVDDHALGLWDTDAAIAAIRPLFGAKMLHMRATPYAGKPMDLDFPVTGLERAIIPLRAACGW